MIHINLLPVREITAEYGRRQEVIFAGLVLGLAVAAMGGLFLLQSARLSKLEGQLRTLEGEIAVLNAQAKGVADLERNIADVRRKLNIIEELRKSKTGPVRILESLSGAIPDRLWLTEFREADGNATMTGLAVDDQTVAEFLRALGASPYFTGVELIETNQAEQGGSRLRRFGVRSGIRYQSPADGSASSKEDKSG